jgi:hypothetical protein
MSSESAINPAEVEKIILKVKERQMEAAPVSTNDDWKSNAVNLAAKGVIGAAIGVAGGMVLVTAAAAVGGAVLSWSAFASVLGIAGAAGGLSHGVVESTNKAKK